MKETFTQYRRQLCVNYIMGSCRYLAENVVDALIDDDFGLLDKDNMKTIVFMVIRAVHFLRLPNRAIKIYKKTKS